MSDTTDLEKEYIARIEREQQEKLAQQIHAEKDAAARAERKALHLQRCGKCGGALKPVGFRGVEIDVCEDCKAVLLDPGELEQLAGNDSTGVVSALASFFSFGRS